MTTIKYKVFNKKTNKMIAIFSEKKNAINISKRMEKMYMIKTIIKEVVINDEGKEIRNI